VLFSGSFASVLVSERDCRAHVRLSRGVVVENCCVGPNCTAHYRGLFGFGNINKNVENFGFNIFFKKKKVSRRTLTS
jgi:hypothetical protein